jgi:hypothetical protein
MHLYVSYVDVNYEMQKPRVIRRESLRKVFYLESPVC